MEQRLDSIVDFAGMQRFIDVPVRHYSSGMYMRLGFAIAVHSDPDILITDEVLAVGDEAFQNKCLERMSKFRDDGVTIILVSHALPVVRTLCSRVLWLRQGSLIMDGDPDAVVDAYIADVSTTPAHAHEEPSAHHRHSTQAVAGLADVRLLGMEMIGADGHPRNVSTPGQALTVRVRYQARKNFPDAAIALQVHDADDQALICGFNSHAEGIATPLHEGEGSIDLPAVALPLRNGRYAVSVAIFRQPDPPAWAAPDDAHSRAYPLRVLSSLTAPRRRWGSGEALLESVRICGENGEEQQDVATGESISIHLRCISTGAPVLSPVVRLQIYAANGTLCHATNTDRAGVELGTLASPADVTLTYDHLDLLEGEYVLSVELTPLENPRRPYDWHDHAYTLRVHSAYQHGDGLVSLSHHWSCG